MSPKFKERIKAVAMSVQCERHWSEEDIEKFGELLIRECAELATKEYDNRGAIHGQDLLEHFGVE